MFPTTRWTELINSTVTKVFINVDINSLDVYFDQYDSIDHIDVECLVFKLTENYHDPDFDVGKYADKNIFNNFRNNPEEYIMNDDFAGHDNCINCVYDEKIYMYVRCSCGLAECNQENS